MQVSFAKARQSFRNTLQHTATHCNTPQNRWEPYLCRHLFQKRCSRVKESVRLTFFKKFWRSPLQLGLFCKNIPIFLCFFCKSDVFVCSPPNLKIYIYMGEHLVCTFILQQKALQHTATHTATHCQTLPHTASHRNALQHTATHCNTLQHTARHCSTLQHTATHCNTLQHTFTHTFTHKSMRKRETVRVCVGVCVCE